MPRPPKIGPCDRPSRQPGRSGGFTLVELMVAVFLMTIGVLAVSQVMVVANRHTASSRSEMLANSLAQEIREKIMTETFADIKTIFNGVDTNNAGSVPAPAYDWATHVEERLGPAARGTIVVTDPGDNPDLEYGMVGVVVTLYWKEGANDVSLPVQFAVAKIGA